MLIFISMALIGIGCILAFAVAILLLEVVAAILLPCLTLRSTDLFGRIAVVIPAHNESTGLLPTLTDVQAQLRSSDQLLVVADNCTDDTAAVALAAGADVSERDDPVRKGKGYALAWGLRSLHRNPPDIVIVIDADCRLGDKVIERLAKACLLTQGPVQALDLMTAPPGASIKHRVMEFTWRIKNWVRPLGLKAIGLPCQLMGTGMAFPWAVISSMDLASGSLVEDLKLGLDLAMVNIPPSFCPEAVVMSEFPSSKEGIESQRLRWEQGHLGMILTTTPRLIYTAIRQTNVSLLALALDATIPPLALLALLTMGLMAVAALATLFGLSSTALVISMMCLAGLSAAVFLCWLKFGRDLVSPGEVPSLISYVIKKIPLYFKMSFRNSGQPWTRTDRTKV